MEEVKKLKQQIDECNKSQNNAFILSHIFLHRQ